MTRRLKGGAVLIGTSGWSHPSWRGPFFPKNVMVKHRLVYYATLLREHAMALCLSDRRDAPAPWEATARHIYIRGHGPGGAYKGRYVESTLRDWARRIVAWKREGRTVYIYFDNDQKSAAPRMPRGLLALLNSLMMIAVDRGGTRLYHRRWRNEGVSKLWRGNVVPFVPSRSGRVRHQRDDGPRLAVVSPAAR